MQPLVLLLATMALLSQSQISCKPTNLKKSLRFLDFMTEIQHSADGKGPMIRVFKKMAKIFQKKYQSTQHVAGEVLELTCEGVGSPAPSIQWFRNDEPIFDYDLESNEIIDSPPSSFAAFRTTLLVPNPSPNEIDVYTCLETAGRKTDVVSTAVLNIDSNSIMSERQNLLPLAPKIVVYYEFYADNLDHKVVLPCRAKGHPRPLVEWFDNNDVLIQNHSRMKVLKTGELEISNLIFEDLGPFTCQATNAFGTTSVTTFVYTVGDVAH